MLIIGSSIAPDMVIQNKRVFLYMVAMSLVAMYLLVVNFKTPYIGIKVSNNGDSSYSVSRINDIGWGSRNGIIVGDVIIKVNNRDAALHSTIVDQNRIEQADSITLQKEDHILFLPIKQNVGLVTQNIYYVIFPTLYFLVNLSLCILLYAFQNNRQEVKWLIILLMTLSLCFISASLSAKLHLIGGYILNLTFLISPVLFLHFMYHYFEKDNKTWFPFKVFYYLYLAVMSFFVGSFVFTEGSYLLFAFILQIIIVGILLFRGYLVFREQEDRAVFQWMVYSLFFSIGPFVLLYATPLIVLGKAIVPSEITAIFIFMMPAIYLYLLCTDKLFRFKFYIKRLSYYLAISLLPAFFITALVNGIYSKEASLDNIIELFFFIHITITLFLYIKRLLDRELRAKLSLEKGQLQESLRRVSESLKKEKSLDGVLNCIKREITDVLGTVSCYCIEVDKEKNVLSIDDHNGIDRFVPYLKKVPLTVGSIFHQKKYFTSVVGMVNNKYIIVVGIMKTPSKLSAEEKEWLEALSYYTSISLENIQKIEDLLFEIEQFSFDGEIETNWLVRLLFKLSEKERGILAADLHDTVLQELLIVKRNCEKLYFNVSDATVKEEIKRIEEGLLDAIYLTRETCHELRPPFLAEMGLEESLKDLISKFQLRSNSILELNISRYTNRLNEEQELAIYRIIQEWLNNARKHAKASYVSIELNTTDEMIELIYKDDGIGMDAESARNSGHMGIFGIKERVFSLGGSYLMNSKPQNGVEYQIKIPLYTNLKGSVNV